MFDRPTTASLVILTAMSLVAGLLAYFRFKGGPRLSRAWRRLQYSLMGITSLGCAALFLYRWAAIHGGLGRFRLTWMG